ncbi:MAG TPA: hypothetical protein VMX38_13620 [Verrucomicrobiae bacterium]|jgi:hypothetical protein|nr:hypothetical protein [Verrucomicrobiae bacterium]
MDTQLTIFIALTAFAVLLQAGVLLAMFITMRKSSQRVEALMAEVKSKVLPTVDQAQSLLADIRPKIEIIAENVAESTTTLRAQVKRVDATVNDAIDRSRLQIIRADELLSRTMDRVEQTSEMVHKTVVSPVRQVSGIMQGITVGLEFLFRNRARRNGGTREERRPVPQDEMFI